jgi:hypothetical protein
MSIALATRDNNFPLQPAIFLRNLSIRGWISSLDKTSKCRGTPRYFREKDPTRQEKI